MFIMDTIYDLKRTVRASFETIMKDVMAGTQGRGGRLFLRRVSHWTRYAAAWYRRGHARQPVRDLPLPPSHLFAP